MGIHQVAIIGPKLFDRKIRAEQATIRAEDRHGIIEDLGDMPAIVAMDEGAEARQLRDDVRAFRKLRHTGAPGGAALWREIFQHARMLKDERHVRAGLCKVGGVSHLRREDLKVKAPAIIGEAGDVAPDCRVSAEIAPCRKAIEWILMPMQL